MLQRNFLQIIFFQNVNLYFLSSCQSTFLYLPELFTVSNTQESKSWLEKLFLFVNVVELNIFPDVIHRQTECYFQFQIDLLLVSVFDS